MLVKRFITIIAISIGLLYSANATTSNSLINPLKRLQSDGSIALPSQMHNGQENNTGRTASPDFYRYEEFQNMSVMLDKTSGSIRRTFGKPIKIEGYDLITKDNAEAASKTFLNKYQEILGINMNNLQLKRISEFNNRFYVSYVQQYNGLEVLLSEIELRIFKDGNVMSFGAVYYDDIDISIIPKMSIEEAMENAAIGIDTKKNKPSIQATSKTYILPVKFGSNVSYSLVYDFRVQTQEPAGNFISYVDANNGNVIWRLNMIQDIQTKVNLSGGIKMKTPLDEEQSVGFHNTFIKIGEEHYRTDENGNISLDLLETAEWEFDFSGTVGSVATGLSNSFTKTKITGQIEPLEELQIELNDNNSKLEERTIYYHLHKAYEFYKQLDPNSTAMDREMTVLLEMGNQQPNAYSNWDTIMFLSINNPQYRMAQGGSVLYHEWGHSLNNFFYRQHGREQGMINRSTHEALADLYASLITDDNYVGKGFNATNPEEYIRNLENDLVYPDDISASYHENGLILAGAFWDIRKETYIDYVANLSQAARYGLPDDPEIGKAYSLWFLETLIADDDDGDLSNGTPNDELIIRSFNRHQIGTDLFVMQSFQFEEYQNTLDTSNAYLLEFDIQGISINGKSIDSVAVHYWYDTPEEIHTIYAVESDIPNRWIAAIPPQPFGTYIRYKFTVKDEISGRIIPIFKHYGTQKYFSFHVGFKTFVRENFEIAEGWIIGEENDNATTGIWDVAVPNGIPNFLFGEGYLQVPENVSDDNDKCFITDPTFIEVKTQFDLLRLFQHMANGRTSVISPIYDLSGVDNAIVSFYMFFAALGLQQGIDSLIYGFDVSSDGGLSWQNAFNAKRSFLNWYKVEFLLNDYIDLSSQIRFRFYIDVPPSQGQMPIAVAEGAFDEFQILIPINSTVSVDDKYRNGNDISIVSYPNPVNVNANFEIRLNNDERIALDIYDVLGNKIAIVADEYLPAGGHRFQWDRIASDGSKIAPGVYYYVLTTQNGQRQADKLIVH